MTVWAIADLHLALGIPNKSMEFFGPPWIGYVEKMKTAWQDLVKPDDLVLLAGDISWAMHLADAKVDLDWIDALPGTKVMLRGNHDYWWSSLKQMSSMLPPSIHIIQNNAYKWNDYVIGGARLWDSPEYQFNAFIDYVENPRKKKLTADDNSPDAEKIFERELQRLELSLKEMDKIQGTKIVMTHYPPIGADLKDSRVSKLLEKHGVNSCVFGHLHNVRAGTLPFGEKNGVTYKLTSADYLGFTPLKLY